MGLGTILMIGGIVLLFVAAEYNAYVGSTLLATRVARLRAASRPVVPLTVTGTQTPPANLPVAETRPSRRSRPPAPAPARPDLGRRDVLSKNVEDYCRWLASASDEGAPPAFRG